MRIKDYLLNIASSRPPDQVIGGDDRPYMLRWFLIPKNRFLNIYLHYFLRSDDDRALHDHPWMNVSWLLKGEYTEHTPAGTAILKAGDLRIRWSGKFSHRIELHAGPCWTLFITGPKYREWGFYCPQGWRHWKVFSSPDGNGVGRGCE